MFKQLIRYAAVAALLLPVVANAEPTTLKLSFFTSNESAIYQCQIKPFVDAVNSDNNDLIRIEADFGRAVRPATGDQLKPVLTGIADITTVAPGYAAGRFTDGPVLHLPGLFRNQAEGNRVYSALIESGALSGYQDLFVVGAFISSGETIHSRKPITNLADLRGQNIRVNNEIEANTLKKFGANPVFIPVNQAIDGIGQGTVDGVTMPTAIVLEFGIGRLTPHHYLLSTGPVPNILVMSRAKFASLPPRAQEIIQKHRGPGFVERAAACMESKTQEVTARLQADTRRKVTHPSQADHATIDLVFAEVAEEWAAQSPRHRELLALVKAEIAKLRSAK